MLWCYQAFDHTRSWSIRSDGYADVPEWSDDGFQRPPPMCGGAPAGSPTGGSPIYRTEVSQQAVATLGQKCRSEAYTNGTPNTGTSEPTITPPDGHGVDRDVVREPHPPPEVDASESSADG